eukprot:gnl/Trimastix_PCT/1851.p1 GENE.gnl/Trimastix_PCT/1851~~gnl/Trimastix_PCT/1851.p1  ORF type:complete len:315 (+),score=47.69 gnl/Trimastix_PCT/1851:256-1200(+)
MTCENHEWVPFFLQHGDIQLCCAKMVSSEISSEAENIPILLIHGVTGSHMHWTCIAKTLMRLGRYSIYAVDLRGRGASSRPTDPNLYGFENHIKDIIFLLDFLGLERCSLVGHSMGAWISLWAAHLHPHRFTSLILVDGAFPPGNFMESGNLEALTRVRQRLEMRFGSKEEYLEYILPGTPWGDLSPAVAACVLYDLEPIPPDAPGAPLEHRVRCALAAYERDVRDLYAKSTIEELGEMVRIPTVLLYAQYGFSRTLRPLISTGSAQAMASGLHLRRVLMIPASDHYTIIRDRLAEQTATHIDSFLHALPSLCE